LKPTDLTVFMTVPTGYTVTHFCDEIPSDAFTLRRLSAGTSQLSGVVNKAPGTFLRAVLLSVSVLLFGGYTFLIYEWTPSSIVIPDIATEIPAKAVALWALGFFVVIGSLLLIASMVARCADRFLDAIPAGSAFGDILSKVFRSITPAILLLLLVIVPLGAFLQSLSSDKVAGWVPPAFAADLARLLGTFGVSASDLAYCLFLFSGTVAAFPVLVMLIGAGRTAPLLLSKRSRSGLRNSNRRNRNQRHSRHLIRSLSCGSSNGPRSGRRKRP
jgi:hypothetical protein